ncbi:hypothetical protein ACVBEH_17125, partial [Roseateles sp. GG27B]
MKADLRNRIAFDAIAGADALLRMLQREVGNDGFDFLLEQALIRALDLNSVVLSVLGGDDDRDTHEMNQRVHGR